MTHSLVEGEPIEGIVNDRDTFGERKFFESSKFLADKLIIALLVFIKFIFILIINKIVYI